MLKFKIKKRIITAPKILHLLTGNFASAMALFPFILIKRKELKNNRVLINHELIHIQQQLELLIFFFYIFYGLEYFLKLLYYKNHYSTYKNISFEKEAYANEQNLNYLKTRRLGSFLKYLA